METFQSSASAQGREFEELCWARLLPRYPGLRRQVTLTDIGVSFDFAVGETYLEAKGSWRGRRPGCIRTDTLKKAICSGALLKGSRPGARFVLLTSHVPTAGAGLAMLNAAKRAGYIDEVIVIERKPSSP